MPLTGVDVPHGYTATDEGFFSYCELQAAQRSSPLGGRVPPIKLYADSAGKTLIAWWYSDCGVGQGVVKPKASRPACVPTATTTGTAPTNS